MNTIQNNNLLAGYLGLQTGLDLGYDRWKSDWFDNRGLINGQRNKSLHFDTDWNWLMAVIKKINFEGFSGGVVYALREATLTADIDKVYTEVVNYINWENEYKKQK